MKKIIITIIACVSLMSCTDNARSRRFGGSQEIRLPVGAKLINITWKENGIWYLTRSMRSDEKEESYKFSEKSSWGVVEGEINIIETK